MYYHIPTQELRNHRHEPIKKLHCPIPPSARQVSSQTERTLHCGNCQHQVLIAHQYNEDELEGLIVKHPKTCLMISPRHIPMLK